MTSPKTAMILAAGLGLRMRPLTNDIPKALVIINGKPLIGHVLDRLVEVGISRVVINIHYKPDSLVAYLEAHPLRASIVISDERNQLLETGGGVRKALKDLGKDPFFVANCDSFFSPEDPNPFKVLTSSWEEKPEGTLLLLAKQENAVGYEGAGDFSMENGALARRGAAPTAPFVFTGLQILAPSLFSGIEKKVFSLNEIYDKALALNTLRGVSYPGQWFHVGTPETVAEVEGLLG